MVGKVSAGWASIFDELRMLITFRKFADSKVVLCGKNPSGFPGLGSSV